MSVMLLLECSGCYDATATVGPLRKRFVSFSGKSYGVGTFQLDDPEPLTPDGWVMFDPYTQCTYCPDCWTCIVEHPSGCGEDEPCSVRAAKVPA